MIQKIDETIGVIGLGYVGLPLAIAFAEAIAIYALVVAILIKFV